MQRAEASPLLMFKAAGIGGVAAAVVSLLLAMLLAALLSTERLPEALLPAMAWPVALGSVFAGAMLAVRMAGKQRLPVALGAGAVYLLLALLGRALWFEGDWSAGPVIAAVTGALAAGLLSSRRKKRRKA